MLFTQETKANNRGGASHSGRPWRRWLLGFCLCLVLSAQTARAEGNFPFTICGDRFCRDDSPTFLNMIDYAPRIPCQDVLADIDLDRVLDDVRRWESYRSGSNPLALRVYPQPGKMPPEFYEEVRDLGFWIVRDIYFSSYDEEDGRAKIDAAIDEVLSAPAAPESPATGAMDRIFAWEFGNEFSYGAELFLGQMCTYLKDELVRRGLEGFSNWVTWNNWPGADELRSVSASVPIHVDCLDYDSYNAYPYWPERVRDHQGGHGTGTPYAGYLAALKQQLAEQYPPVKPLVISETGLPDSPSVEDGEQARYKPWYPAYRFGGLSGEQVAEGLSDRYWDAVLTGAAGIGFFEWNDEWWKSDEYGQECVHNDVPEEYFGLLSFDLDEPGRPGPAGYKTQQQAVQDLFNMRLPASGWSVSVAPDDSSVPRDGSTTIRATTSCAAAQPVIFRWETSRGFIVGDSDIVQFYAGGRALGQAQVTVVAIDGKRRANTASTTVDVERNGSPSIKALTLGPGPDDTARAAGRVADVDLGASGFKAAVYIGVETGGPGSYTFSVQPYGDMKHIWIRPDGYWWTEVHNSYNGSLLACLVPESFEPVSESGKPSGWQPSQAIACDRIGTANDSDNDRLTDSWEVNYFGDLSSDTHEDPDADLADNLEELLAGTSPIVPDNDSDSDLLPDTWEYRYFGTLAYDADDDPDADGDYGLDNGTELTLGLHPGRTAVDKDRDGLPDAWEIRWFGGLSTGPGDDPDKDGYTNLEEYRFATVPTAMAVPVLSRTGICVLSLLLVAIAVLVPRRGVRRGSDGQQA